MARRQIEPSLAAVDAAGATATRNPQGHAG